MAFGILEKVRYAVLAQQVEHFHGEEEVGSSNLLNGFKIFVAWLIKKRKHWSLLTEQQRSQYFRFLNSSFLRTF